MLQELGFQVNARELLGQVKAQVQGVGQRGVIRQSGAVSGHSRQAGVDFVQQLWVGQQVHQLVLGEAGAPAVNIGVKGKGGEPQRVVGQQDGGVVQRRWSQTGQAAGGRGYHFGNDTARHPSRRGRRPFRRLPGQAGDTAKDPRIEVAGPFRQLLRVQIAGIKTAFRQGGARGDKTVGLRQRVAAVAINAVQNAVQGILVGGIDQPVIGEGVSLGRGVSLGIAVVHPSVIAPVFAAGEIGLVFPFHILAPFEQKLGGGVPVADSDGDAGVETIPVFQTVIRHCAVRRRVKINHGAADFGANPRHHFVLKVNPGFVLKIVVQVVQDVLKSRVFVEALPDVLHIVELALAGRQRQPAVGQRIRRVEPGRVFVRAGAGQQRQQRRRQRNDAAPDQNARNGNGGDDDDGDRRGNFVQHSIPRNCFGCGLGF